jgi:hypothetical protein
MIAHRPAVAVCPARLHREIRRELGPVAVGVGGPAEGPAEIARSYTQARRALNFRKRSRAPDGLTVYDQLGLYRILTADPAQAELDDFLHDQLGALLDYDSTHRAELVKTLAVYLDHGGNYDNTAHALVIHRSTLRYRLHRIRDIICTWPPAPGLCSTTPPNKARRSTGPADTTARGECLSDLAHRTGGIERAAAHCPDSREHTPSSCKAAIHRCLQLSGASVPDVRSG